MKVTTSNLYSNRIGKDFGTDLLGTTDEEDSPSSKHHPADASDYIDVDMINSQKVVDQRRRGLQTQDSHRRKGQRTAHDSALVVNSIISNPYVNSVNS